MKTCRYALVIVTTDTKKSASDITKIILKKRLAACIQSFPIKSDYRWEGKYICDTEIRLEIKTAIRHFGSIKKEILNIHPYKIPEIIMIPILDGNTLYLEWIDEETADIEGLK